MAICSHGQNSLSKTNEFSPVFVYPGVYKTRTVYNLRIRENNIYKGAVYREIREKYSLVSDTPAEKRFAGTTYIFEELKAEGRDIARKVDNIIDGSFTVTSDGNIKRADDSYFPLITGFPVYPEKQNFKIGDKWRAAGDVFVDPLKKNLFTKINFLCEYTYTGIIQYKGVDVYAISAQYAMRYNKGDDPFGDKDLEKVSGSHKITIYLTTEDALPFFLQDNIDDIYTYPSLAVSVKGFSHTWYSDVVPMKRDIIKKDVIESIIKSSLDSKDFEIKEKEEGISLSTNNIHFVPDKADLLPGEEKKVEIISSILKKIPDRTFLVTGHTADIGTQESQIELSVKRAEKIAELLKRSGISGDRIIFTGKGGSEPAADNSTDEGRAKNRRVEIIILED
ncbi:MAG: OmpA family protein [Spirochaetaceae bacterium]|nr:OmpA family protein [Spirochaetaceae bacterium]